jgi:hypothetical protein
MSNTTAQTFSYCPAIDSGAVLYATEEEMVERMEKGLPTFEYTGSSTNTTNLYLDYDLTVQHDMSPDEITEKEDKAVLAAQEIIGNIYLTDPVFAVSTDHRRTEKGFKFSMHIHVPNIRDRKDKQRELAIKINKSLEDQSLDKFDLGVYDKNRKMRCVGTSKPNKFSPLKMLEGAIIDTLITRVCPGAYTPKWEDEPTPVTKAIQSRLVYAVDDDELIEQYSDYMKLINVEHFSEYGKWFKIQCASANLRIPFEVYDGFMRGTKNYDRHTNYDYYHRPCTAEKALGWGHIKNIAYEFKPHEKMELDKKWCCTNVAETDLDAAKIILKRYRRVLKSYKGRIFLKENNIWITDSQRIEDTLFQIIMASGITKGKDKNGKDIEFVKNYSAAEKVKKTLMCMIRIDNEDPTLYDKFHSSMKGALCFQDGVLNFQTGSFELWTEIPDDKYYSPMQIPRKYGDYFNDPDMTIVEKVKSDVFETLYGDKTDTALQFLSRAAAGHCEDKNWSFYLGNRNCGKGVMFEILNSALGDYMSSFELGHIMYSRKTEGMDAIDSTKRLYWLLDYEFKRIALSQEVPEPKVKKIVNGSLFKKIQGGGDVMQARRNYDRVDTFFKLDTTFMMMGNHQLEFDSADCWEQGLEFSSVYQFQSQAVIDAADPDTRMRLRLADDSIKGKCSSVEWGNACLYLLMMNYKNTKVSIVRETDTEDSTFAKSYITIAKELFDCSDPNAMMLGSEVFPEIQACIPEKQSFDKKKCKDELALINFHYKKCNVKTHEFYGKWVVSGLKPKLEDIQIVNE